MMNLIKKVKSSLSSFLSVKVASDYTAIQNVSGLESSSSLTLPMIKCEDNGESVDERTTARLSKTTTLMITRVLMMVYILVVTGSICMFTIQREGLMPGTSGSFKTDTATEIHQTRPHESYGTKESVLVKPCGETPEEARAAGCNFDIISFSWLPDQCYDKELVEEFRNYTDWQYWLDQNQTQSLSQELAWTGNYASLFTMFEYHLVHCTFLWKKMHRALLGPGKLAIDSVTGSMNHTAHCSKMLLTRREVSMSVVNAVILVKFPDCGLE